MILILIVVFSIKWFRDTDEIFSYIATLSHTGNMEHHFTPNQYRKYLYAPTGLLHKYVEIFEYLPRFFVY